MRIFSQFGNWYEMENVYKQILRNFLNLFLRAGSLLIRKLCEQMRQAFVDDEKYKFRHLEDVLKKVQKQISRDIRRIKRENAIRLCQQTIEWRSTLMDFVRFELKKKQDRLIEPSSNLQNVP